MRNNMSIWDIFYKLPIKRQQRLKNRKNKTDMDMEIEIDFQEIAIIKETESSIMAMVPCVSNDITKNLYIEYFFESKQVEISHAISNVSFMQKIRGCVSYLFGNHYTLGKMSTVVTSDQIEQIVDFLASVIEDIHAANTNDDE